RVGRVFELAVGGADEPLQLLRNKGWLIRNPLQLDSPGSYQRYLQDSKAEFTVAKEGYVISRSGWFSERSAAYLACGRPVVTQDTGFSNSIETGAGLIAFSTPEEAITGVEA